jgi:hypothetical protein
MVFTVATAQAYSVVGEQTLYTSQSDGALITQVVGNQILEWRLPRDGWGANPSLDLFVDGQPAGSISLAQLIRLRPPARVVGEPDQRGVVLGEPRRRRGEDRPECLDAGDDRLLLVFNREQQ